MYRESRRKCMFCEDRSKKIDYKDVELLKRFLTDRGKILPRRHTANCAKHQREIAKAIEMAREMAILPYGAEFSI
ncbi:MAG: 30S ribosomal protein S18 [Candidatus Cloacimonadota bacterium]|nr:MAG: 30S ribosomal protein S18 [Candidatus Cloacimonadota bacterium]